MRPTRTTARTYRELCIECSRTAARADRLEPSRTTRYSSPSTLEAVLLHHDAPPLERPLARARLIARVAVVATVGAASAGCSILIGLNSEGFSTVDASIAPGPMTDAAPPESCVTPRAGWQLDCNFASFGIFTFPDSEGFAMSSPTPVVRSIPGSDNVLVFIGGVADGGSYIATQVSFPTGTPTGILRGNGVPVDINYIDGYGVALIDLTDDAGAHVTSAELFDLAGMTQQHEEAYDLHAKRIVAAEVPPGGLTPQSVLVLADTDPEGPTSKSALVHFSLTATASPPVVELVDLTKLGAFLPTAAVETSSTYLWLATTGEGGGVLESLGDAAADLVVHSDETASFTDALGNNVGGVIVAGALPDPQNVSSSELGGIYARMVDPNNADGATLAYPGFAADMRPRLVRDDEADTVGGAWIITATAPGQVGFARMRSVDGGLERDLGFARGFDGGLVVVPVPNVFSGGNPVKIGSDVCVSVVLGDLGQFRAAIACFTDVEPDAGADADTGIDADLDAGTDAAEDATAGD